ncbi:hypothetical protein [Sinomonas sp. ASV322]|uniref:hypothetical protein n=1 Tax=Sinomonas sp. ASV322 TaxID=3041920 RepID=UPI0027DCC200|nr:hypothetical protein [Sinomonas sp. ASV322]MDQ4504458.1 hypothetical protein [Sinomonas sp. ASV322]
MTHRLIKLAAGLALVAACAGCASASPTSGSSAAPTMTATADSLPPTWGTGPQAPEDPNAPKPTAVAWSAESRAAATSVAVKFMSAYARPGTAQPAWADALAPYASMELMATFRQADTKYLTTSAPAATGTLTADDSNPYNGVVTVGTSEGPWQLGVHRQPDGSWRVASIQPPVRQGH